MLKSPELGFLGGAMRATLRMLIFFVCGFTFAKAHACSCVARSSPCGPTLAHDHMILGTVLRVRVVDNEHTLPNGTKLFGGGHRVFTVAVAEDFGGTHRAGEEIEVETGMGGGDCGYGFRLGERYLIDAYAHDGKLSAGICGQTAPEAAAGLALRELRETASGRLPAMLSGSVMRYSASNGPNAPVPQAVPRVPVVVTGSDGIAMHTETAADGVYEIQSLAPGNYEVAFQIPDGLMAWSTQQKPFKLSVPQPGPTPKICQISLRVSTAGRLEGRVVNGQGESVAGSLSVYTHAPTGKPPGFWSAGGSTDADGTFSIGPLEAGMYWLYFEPKTDGEQHWYYPGSRDPAAAVPLSVEDGKATSGLTFVVTP